MAIIKSKNLVETYRAKAGAKDINELSGRTGRADLTNFVTEDIVNRINCAPNAIIIDIGCGNGLLLQKIAVKIDSFQGRIFGVLPTKEEVMRVKAHLLDQESAANASISIELGLAEKSFFPSNYADIIICNGVLNGAGNGEENVFLSIKEFYRILKPNGCLYIGEIPDSDEFAKKKYNNSIILWLIWVLKNQGYQAFILRFKQVSQSLFGKEPFIIGPKFGYYSKPEKFMKLLNENGLEVVEHYRHKEIDLQGNVSDTPYRWNYWLTKK